VEVQVPELVELDTTLASAAPTTRSGDVHPRQLGVRLSLGDPLSVALTPDFAADDNELRAFVESEAASARYWLVHLACTFSPADGELLESAWLTVTLRREDGGGIPRPIAWSMSPMRQERPVQRSRTLKIGAKAKVIEASADAGTTVTGGLVYLEALNLQEPTPSWEFRRTAADEITGSCRLALVVRGPREVGVDGTVELTATVRTRRFGLLAVRADVPDRPSLTFPLR
jgi:hypothetical protein